MIRKGMNVLFERCKQAFRWCRWPSVRDIVGCAMCTWTVVCVGLSAGSTTSIALMVWIVKVRSMSE